MNYFSVNLKFLRKRKKLTQADFASKIGISRPIVGSYEEGRAEPKLVTLQNISHFFKVKIDDLLERDLSQRKRLATKDFEGNDLRILPIVVNNEQEEKISLVPIKASAGYLNGYADPEFIEQLPNFNLPFNELSQGTYRAFQINGDSMLPIQEGSYILTKYLENWNWIKNNRCYVIVSKEEGVVYKRVINQFESAQQLELHSDNRAYETYAIKDEQILEVWEALGYISFSLPDKEEKTANSMEELNFMMQQLKNDVEQLKKN